MIADISRGAFAKFSAGMDPAAIEAYREHYGRLDPIRPAAERNPPGAILSDRALFYHSTGDHAKAMPLDGQALGIALTLLDRFALE